MSTTLSAAAALALALPALPQTMLTATVNDARSHGSVGDPFLSLDEAIRLANGTLSMTLLSAQERAQITGTGTMVDQILVDAMMVPTITLEQPLSDLMGQGGMAMIMGMATPAGQRPVLVGGNHATVLSLRSRMVQVMGLEIRRGQVGIDVAAAMTAGGANDMTMVMDCVLDGQNVAGVKAHAAGTEMTRVMVVDTSFRSQPVGLLVDDQSNMGMVMLECEHLAIDTVTIGIDVVENGRQNLSMVMVFRSTMRNGQIFLRVQRGATSDQQFMVRIVHCDIATFGNCVNIQGNASGLTMVHHHHTLFSARAGFWAFQVGPRTALFDFHGSENTFDGNVAVAANLFSQRVWHQNNQYRNGIVTVDVDGALPNLLWNRYENCTLVVPATARAAVRVRQAELLSTNVDGRSPLAPITLDGCFLSNGTTSGSVTTVNAAPARFLGTTSVSPGVASLGGTLTLRTDLPLGIGAIWDVALSYPRPSTAIEPVRFYGDPATAILLPGMAIFQSRTDIPIPNAPALSGVEFYVQAVAVPVIAMPYAPPFHLPVGGLVLLQ